eukprot:scaffold64100_cov54-Phaeocystis_antarctica.AAC.2
MASASMRHSPARWTNWAFAAGASHSTATRSKCAAASLNSTADRGPACQAPPPPCSTTARMVIALQSFGAARKTLADSALSPSSFHHSGLATSAHSFCCSSLKASAVALAQYSEPTGKRSLASRYRCEAST